MIRATLRGMLVGVTLLLAAVSDSEGHGRLLEPPSRASAWRSGILGAPANYNDNQLYCGGYNRHWAVNGGRCGICGDPWDGPREHEAGGKYALGILTRTYNQGDLIQVKVQVTAFHKGWFEFRICPNNDVTKVATQACLDRHLLPVITTVGRTTRYDITNRPQKNYILQLQLPANLTCNQCVLQWKWNAGNNWGVDSTTGKACVGCGPQEQFYGCADVQIKATNEGAGPETVNPVPTVTDLDSTTTTSVRERTTAKTTSPPEVMGPATPDKDELSCHAVSIWKQVKGMDQWCTDNCKAGHCPKDMCTCNPKKQPESCKPTGPEADINKWCRATCGHLIAP